MALSPGPSPKIWERGEEGRRSEGEVFGVALFIQVGYGPLPRPLSQSPGEGRRGEAF